MRRMLATQIFRVGPNKAAISFKIKGTIGPAQLTGSRKVEEGAPEKTVRAPLWNVALGVAIAIGLTWLVWTV